jgi:hypothetical protein
MPCDAGKSTIKTIHLRSTPKGGIEDIEKDDNNTGTGRMKTIARPHFEKAVLGYNAGDSNARCPSNDLNLDLFNRRV